MENQGHTRIKKDRRKLGLSLDLLVKKIQKQSLPTSLHALPGYLLLKKEFSKYISCQVIYHEKGRTLCPNFILSRSTPQNETELQVASFNSTFNTIYKSKNKLFNQSNLLKTELGVVGTFLGKALHFSDHKMIIILSRNDFLPPTSSELSLFDTEVESLHVYLNSLLKKELLDRKTELHSLVHTLLSSDENITPSELYHQERIALLGDLLNTLKHELSNPLFGIKLSSDLSLEDNLSIDAKETLVEIGRSATRSQKIIENFSMLYDSTPVEKVINLKDLIHETILLTKSETKSLHKEVVFDGFKDENMILLKSNPTWLGQIIFNLVLNSSQAIRQTNAVGKIKIYCQLTPESLSVSVIDNGAGISDEFRERIFKPFFTTKPEGTGLGLSICQMLANKMGGVLDFSSDPKEKLTIFKLQLPKVSCL